MGPAEIRHQSAPQTATQEPRAPAGLTKNRTGGSAQLVGRLVSSSLLILCVVGILFVFPLWVFAVVVIAFGMAALFEFFTMARNRGILVHRPLSMTLGLIFMTLVAWRALADMSGVAKTIPESGAAMLSWSWDIFWPAAIIIIFLRQFTRRNMFEALSGLSTTLFGLAYIGGLWGYIFYLRALKHANGAWLVGYLVLVTKMSDVGAFTIGRTLGRHSLVPRISPRKTVEGLLGGVAFSAVTAALATPMVPQFHGSMIESAAVGVLLGLFGQLGDLAESLIKRDCQLKDSAQWIPGLGGMLDVIDSLLFTAPLFYAVLIYG